MALYIDLNDMIDEFAEGIGIKVDLEIPNTEDTEWLYNVMGGGDLYMICINHDDDDFPFRNF